MSSLNLCIVWHGLERMCAGLRLSMPVSTATMQVQEAGLPAPYALQWLRYTAFTVLYPIGVSSELTMAWLAMPIIRARRVWSVDMPNSFNLAFDYYLACWAVIALYLPGGPSHCTLCPAVATQQRLKQLACRAAHAVWLHADAEAEGAGRTAQVQAQLTPSGRAFFASQDQTLQEGAVWYAVSAGQCSRCFHAHLEACSLNCGSISSLPKTRAEHQLEPQRLRLHRTYSTPFSHLSLSLISRASAMRTVDILIVLS